MRRNELIANIFLQFGPAIILLVLSVVCVVAFDLLTTAPAYYVVTLLALWAVGFAMFLKAKLSVIKQGKLVSFGPGPMSRTNRTFYIWGYVVMALAFVMSLLLLAYYRGAT